MTIGKDRKLITWNLIKGRSAYVTNIKEIADFVKWSPDGQRFVIGFYKHVDVYSTSNASIEYSISIKGRANAIEFLNDTTIALAGDMPEIEIHSLTSQEMIRKFKAHEIRVRCLTYLAPNCLITASNDGLIKVCIDLTRKITKIVFLFWSLKIRENATVLYCFNVNHFDLTREITKILFLF